MAGIDLIVERRYVEGGREVVEQVTWQHIADPEPRWRWARRRFRRPKLVEVSNGASDGRGRPLPGWCAPDYPPNRWLWVRAVQPAADLKAIPPDQVLPDGSPIYLAGSEYWAYYDVPVRAGVVLITGPNPLGP